MKEQRSGTKERILDSALNLFSEKGYDGVGVDAIAEQAGLKGPSIYKHFKSKEEILDTLIREVDSYYEKNFGSKLHPGKIPASTEELVDISWKRIRFTLKDDRIRKTRRILAMEQFRSPQVAKLATRYSLENIQGIYQKLFKEMMDAGVIRQGDPAMLSMAFIAPITLLINMCDREPEREQEAMNSMKEYMNYFAKQYLQENKEENVAEY